MSIVFMLLPYVLVGAAGLGAGWFLTRAHARTVALHTVLQRVEVWMRYLTAQIDKADLRQDRRAEYLIDRALGRMDTVQIPTLRVVGAKEDPASVSLPAQARRSRRNATVTQLDPERILGYFEGALAAAEGTGEFPVVVADEEPSGDITREAT